MAQIRFYKVQITLNELSKHVKNVPEWEVGVLQAQWGDDALVIEDETSPFTVERKLPDPKDEFQRLAQSYGPRHGDTPFVASVYGNFGPGINALRDAIARASQPIPAAPPEVDVTEQSPPDEILERANEPVAAGGTPVSELLGDEGGDPTVNDFADLAGNAADEAETAA